VLAVLVVFRMAAMNPNVDSGPFMVMVLSWGAAGVGDY